MATRRRLRYLERRARYIARARKQRRRLRKFQRIGAVIVRWSLPHAAVYHVGPWLEVPRKIIPPDIALNPAGEAGFLQIGYPTDGDFQGNPPRVVFLFAHAEWEGPNSHPEAASIGLIPWPVKARGRKLEPKTTGKRRTRTIRYAQRLWKKTGVWPAWAPVGWKLSTP